MPTKRPDSFEEFQRKQQEKRFAALPPLTHNYPDLPTLSHEEITYVEAAREALATMKRTFEFWVVIARGLKTLKEKAERIGGRFTFDHLREREGLGGKRRDGTDILNKARVSRLLAILEHLPEVEAWRNDSEKVSQKERFEWASPEAIHRHCPVFAVREEEEEKAKRPSPYKQLQATNVELQEQLHEANARLQADGDQFDLDKTGAETIGKIIVKTWRMQPSRIETLIRTLSAELKELRALTKAARPKQKQRSNRT